MTRLTNRKRWSQDPNSVTPELWDIWCPITLLREQNPVQEEDTFFYAMNGILWNEDEILKASSSLRVLAIASMM